MKKIISLLAAVAMASTAFVATVSAATLPSSVTIKTATPVKVDATEYEDNTEETLENGYSAYKVVVTLDTNGVNLTGESSKSAKGVQLGNFTYDILFDDATNIQQGWVSGDVYQSADSGCDKFDPNNAARYFFASNVVYPGAVKDTTITMPKEMITLYFAIKDGTQATATVTDNTLAYIGNYSGGSSSDLVRFEKAYNNIVFEPASFTIGEVAGGDEGDDEFSFTTGTKNEITTANGAKGIVWAGATLVNVDTFANEYYAMFKDSNTDYGSRETLLKLDEAIESDGTITYDAVMRFSGDARTGVDFKVEERPIVTE